MPPKSKKTPPTDEEMLELQRKRQADALYFTPKKKNKAWEDLLADYEKQFARRAESDGALVFETKEQAVAFFTNQATLEREFLVSEATADRQPTGQHMFSCGNGTLYCGTLTDIKQQLESALKQGDSPKLRAGLSTINSYSSRHEMSSLRKNDVEQAARSNKTPTPFKT